MTIYVLRSLVRAPAFTLPALASLALAIAVNTTMFAIFNAVLLKPLPAADAHELIRIGRTQRGERQYRSVTYEEFAYLSRHARSLDVVGHQIDTVTLITTDTTDAVSAEFVTGNYFTVLGAPPAVGRGFAASEDRAAGDAPVAVISDRLWRRRFDGNPAMVGTALSLNGQPFTVVGVARPGFHGTFPGVDTDIWLPSMMADAVTSRVGPRNPPSLALIGRLKNGGSMHTAQAELDVLTARMDGDMPGRDRNRRFLVAGANGVIPLFARIATAFLSLLMALVGVVLLVACANVASLLVARASARRTEVAVRLALGASRSRVVTHLLVENLILAVSGAAMGLLLTRWAIQILNTLRLATGPTGAPIFFDLQIDVRVLLFTASVTFVTTLAFGLLPALHATRVDVISSLKETPSLAGVRRNRLRAGLVVAQVALSFVLIVAAGLLFRSLRNAGDIDLGFEPAHVLVTSFDLQPLGYDRPRVERFYDELLRRVRTAPGVERAALADFVPTVQRGGTAGVTIAGAVPPAGEDHFSISFGRASDGYFETVRQALVRGRDFSPRDTSGAPMAVIINEAMARRFWAGTDAVGKRIIFAGESTERQIVGVAKDTKLASLADETEPFMYLPVLQHHRPALTLHVRTAADPAQALAGIRRIVRDIDANVAPLNGATMQERMSFALVPAKIARGVFGVAGAIAVLLAAGGLYGLVCYTLAQRIKEIGIRIALGATRQNVLRLIVGGALKLTLAGIALGVVLAAAAMRFLSSLLYDVSPADPLTFGGAAALLVCLTLIAGYVAARQGLGATPIVALRHE